MPAPAVVSLERMCATEGVIPETIDIAGAREHNLRSVDLKLPKGVWTAVTGVSGSGKTSLVFDTLVREGRLRFLQSWSPRARQAFGKLGAARVGSLTGLPVPLAVGADRMTRTERSTVGTLTGISDLLRLVFARDGTGAPHSRSAFSFNSTGACEACAGIGSTEVIDLSKVVVAPEKSIRDGALGPTLANGYTVYSQVTLEVMDTICAAHGFDVHTPWCALTGEQQEVVLYGTTALTVPFGKHSLESRLKWEGITARPRQEGTYRGLIPVMTETLKRTRNPNILKYASSETCAECSGSRLGRIGRETRLGTVTLPELSAVPLRALHGRVADLQSPVLEVMRSGLETRIQGAVQLGLGHLSLDRRSTTLSDGELQRTRLLSQLGLELGGLLLAFDEPTLGLHPEAHPGLEKALRRLVQLGNTVLTVEHHPVFVAAADHWVELGPGAGTEGGRVVQQRAMPEAPLGGVSAGSRCRSGTGELILRGARLHGLNTDVSLKRGSLNVICGPSGAGKSSLVFGTLLPALEGRAGVLCEGLEGGEGLGVVSLDATPLGRTPRSTPATYTGLFDAVRKLYAGLGPLTASHFSHNHALGRCEVCEGLGVERVGLHLMRDVERVCGACGGGRYRPEVLGVEWRGVHIAALLQRTVDEALPLFGGVETVEPMLRALQVLGLGYLQLGRSTTTLSRGEAQRIRLATLLGRPRAQETAVLLDEPDRGLHPVDLERLQLGLQALVDEGHTLVAISHHPTLWAAADHLVEVRLGVARVLDVVPPQVRETCEPSVEHPPDCIELRGVRTHNLRGFDVRLPHRALTVICGVSGSGKSSLAMHTLAAEAQRRFSETLPFQVRRHLRRLERPELEEATGLTPTLVLEQRVGGGSTVATVSGLGPLLRLLYAREGTLEGEPTRLLAEHFSTIREAGRCEICAGRGASERCDPRLLVTESTLPIGAGALGGTKPGRFFTEPDGRHLALLSAAGGEALLTTPWEALTDAQRHLALWGAPGSVQGVWKYRRGKRTGEHALDEPWTGLVALVEEEARLRRKRKDAADWRAPFREVPCEACEGTGLQAPARQVLWGGLTLPERLGQPLDRLAVDLEGHSTLRPLLQQLREGIAALRSLSLGHLPLGRDVAVLSGGERQRLRLAEVLTSGLTGLTLVLDEPDAGLDDAAIRTFLAVLHRLIEQGNTVVVVSHHESVLWAADQLVELGPGAGPDGGGLLEVGAPEQVLAGEGPTARGLRLGAAASSAPVPWGEQPLPRAGLVGLAGPSGSGKSTLLRTLDVPGYTTVRGGDLAARTVGYALGWMKPLGKRFHQANPTLPARAFSHHSAAGRCAACKGAGVERVSLDVMADLELPCEVCQGRRYREAVLEARLEGAAIDEVLALPLQQLGGFGFDAGPAVRLGLGHLSLGTAVGRLSGGERQRLGLLVALHGRPGGRLILLDGPTRGLHALDLEPVLEVLRELGEAGDLVVVASQRAGLLGAMECVFSLESARS